MRADKVLRRGFLCHCRFQRGFGQKAGLQRQQIAENARQCHHNVNARAAQFGQRNQVRARQAAIGIKARGRADQRQGLRNRPAIGFDIVRPPQHHRHRTRQGRVRIQQLLRLHAAFAQRESGGHAERVEGMDVAPRGHNLRRADQITAGHRRDILRRQRAH